MVTGSNIDFSRSTLCLSIVEQQVHVFIFNRSKKLLFYEVKLITDIFSLDYIKQPFVEVYVSFSDSNASYTIVPKSLFIETHASQYFLSTDSKNIKYKEALDYMFLFPSIDKFGFEAQIPSLPTIFPEQYFFLKSQIYFKAKHEKAIVLNKRNHWMDVLFYDNEKIILFNSYSIAHENDIAYYILLIYNQHLLDQKVVPLMFCGDISSLQPAIEIMKMYIKILEPITVKIETELLYNNIPFEQHTPLLTSFLCE